MNEIQEKILKKVRSRNATEKEKEMMELFRERDMKEMICCNETLSFYIMPDGEILVPEPDSDIIDRIIENRKVIYPDEEGDVQQKLQEIVNKEKIENTNTISDPLTQNISRSLFALSLLANIEHGLLHLYHTASEQKRILNISDVHRFFPILGEVMAPPKSVEEGEEDNDSFYT